MQNPYNCLEPATAPHFIGRDKELRRIYQAVREGHSISVVGDWQTGRSSLLKAVAGFYQSSRTVVEHNGMDSASRSMQSFVETISGMSTTDEPDRAADVLGEWAHNKQRSGKPPLLLIDDVEGCFQRFPSRFFERLRGMLYKITLIFSSHQELDLISRNLNHLDNTLYPQISPLENRLEIVRLGLLPEKSAGEIIARCGNELDKAGKAIMRRWAGTHPYYLQLTGACLWQAAHNGDSRESALDRVYSHARPRLRQVWESLSPREREVLLQALHGKQSEHRNLRLRGLLDSEGRLFGRILHEWLSNEVG